MQLNFLCTDYSIFKYQFSFHFYLVARSLSRNKSVIPSVFNKTTVRCLYPDCLSGAVAQKNQFFLSPLFGVRDSIMQNFKFTSMNLNFKEGIENSKDLNQMTEVKV
ncbi:unnamed protein product [Rhizophagus irregularis]|nr:unnamed protein product [Rhizophagus irregularis]